MPGALPVWYCVSRNDAKTGVGAGIRLRGAHVDGVADARRRPSRTGSSSTNGRRAARGLRAGRSRRAAACLRERQRRHDLVAGSGVLSTGVGADQVVPLVDVESTMRASPSSGSGCVGARSRAPTRQVGAAGTVDRHRREAVGAERRGRSCPDRTCSSGRRPSAPRSSRRRRSMRTVTMASRSTPSLNWRQAICSAPVWGSMASVAP